MCHSTVAIRARRLLVPIAVLWGAMPAVVHADSGLAGRIWDPRAEAFVSADAAMARAAASDFVLLGERHDNPLHHRLQADVVAAIAAAGRRPAVVWEMIPTSRQDDLDRWRAGAADADGMAAAVDWAGSGWPPWAAYRPVAEAALAAALPIRAGDLPVAERRAVAEGTLAPDLRGALGLDAPLPPEQEAALLDALFEGHCRLVPRDSLGPMFAVQRARDGSLAAAMLEADRSGADGAVLIAGAGHARRDVAVPQVLMRAAPGRAILSIAFVEVGPEDTDPAALVPPGAGGTPRHDLLWLTPPGPSEDHCAALRERFRKPPE